MTTPIRMDTATADPAHYVHCQVTVDGEAIGAAVVADEQAGLVIEVLCDPNGRPIFDDHDPCGVLTRERRGVVRIEPTEKNLYTRADLEARYAIG